MPPRSRATGVTWSWPGASTVRRGRWTWSITRALHRVDGDQTGLGVLVGGDRELDHQLAGALAEVVGHVRGCDGDALGGAEGQLALSRTGGRGDGEGGLGLGARGQQHPLLREARGHCGQDLDRMAPLAVDPVGPGMLDRDRDLDLDPGQGEVEGRDPARAACRPARGRGPPESAYIAGEGGLTRPVRPGGRGVRGHVQAPLGRPFGAGQHRAAGNRLAGQVDLAHVEHDSGRGAARAG